MTYAPSAIGGDFAHMLFADMAIGLNLDPIPHLVGHNPQLLLPKPRRYHVIGKGRLHFDDALLGPPPTSLLRERTATFEVEFRTDPSRMASLAVMLGRDPIPHLVGHNPQLLLTASPEAEAMSALAKVGLAAVALVDQATRMWERIYPHRIAIINADDVTRETLERVAQVKGLREIVINIEGPSGELSPIFPGPPIFRDYARSVEYRPRPYYQAMLERDRLRTAEARAKPRPAYLKHDPSKRHGRGRRKW